MPMLSERFGDEKEAHLLIGLIVLDDVHHVAVESNDLLGALLDISKSTSTSNFGIKNNPQYLR